MTLVDDSAKILEEKLKMLSIRVEEEFEGTERELAQIRAAERQSVSEQLLS